VESDPGSGVLSWIWNLILTLESYPGSGVLSWIWTLILALESHLGFRVISWLWNALDSYPGSGSRMKISGNLLGQNDQNFDIYPLDWSHVASWGLAAEGEALTIDIDFSGSKR